MKRVKKPNFSRVPQNGEHITVSYGRAMVQGRVRRSSGGGRQVNWSALYKVSASPTLPLQRLSGSVRRRDEGTTWVRGWEGEAVDAFVVARALYEW